MLLQDSDKVDTTRYIQDRLARPGPRRRPGIDLKYLYFGFAYLQVGKRWRKRLCTFGKVLSIGWGNWCEFGAVIALDVGACMSGSCGAVVFCAVSARASRKNPGERNKTNTFKNT